MKLELRQLRYSLALAHALHFGKAALVPQSVSNLIGVEYRALAWRRRSWPAF